jgi:chromate transporter
MILLQLFISFFQIGLFDIGGGYVAMPLIQQQIVNLHGWLTMSQFADVVTIAEMTPGPIALNAATFVGMKVYGFAGALVATGGVILAPCLISLLMACLYRRFSSLGSVQAVLSGLRPAVVGIIGAAGLSITAVALWGGTLLNFHFANLNYVAIGLFAAALFAELKWKVNPIFLILGTGIIGFIIYSVL